MLELSFFFIMKMANFLVNQARILDKPTQIVRKVDILSMILFLGIGKPDNTIYGEIVTN